MTVTYLLATLALLAANAFFVAVEFSLITSRHEKLEPLASDGRRSARIGLRSMQELSMQLAGAQLGVTMASLGLGFVGEPAVSSVLESVLAPVGVPDTLVHVVAFAVALLAVSFLHLVLGEMVPKNVAVAGPERMLLWLALPNAAYVAVFRPIIWTLNQLANLGTRALGAEPQDELAKAHSAGEIAVMVASSKDEGLIQDFEHDLLSRAIHFGGQAVRTVMVPRSEIVTVSLRARVAEVERTIVGTGHSRLPVTGRDLDDVVGFVHAKDLLALPASSQPRQVGSVRRRRMLRVHAETTLEQVLVRMRSSQVHVAVVVDAGGRTVGLVTLEDVLESLVGDIRDESDRAEEAAATAE